MFKNTRAFSGFSVDDLAAARRFYGETLGVAIDDAGEGQLVLRPAGAGKIFVYQKDNHTPATFTILNFLVDSVDDAVRDLNARGVRFEIYDEENLKTDERGISRDDGPTIAWFKDPAGNILSVLEEPE